MDNNNVIRFLLTFFLGFIGSLIINHTSLKPEGFRSRTLAYVFLTILTFGIYGLVASIFNLAFDPNKSSNIGYIKE
jgi:H+/Cl- antiporter ClcA